MSTNETCQLTDLSGCPTPTTQANNSWFRKFVSDGSHPGSLELHASARCQDDTHHQVNAPLTRDEQYSETHKTYSLCSVTSEDGKGDASVPGTCVNENTLPHINTTRHHYQAQSRISILPQGNEDHEMASAKKKVYQQELLKQMQIDRMRKYKEKDLDNQLQRGMDHQLCNPGAPLRDVYGNIIMIRKSENLIKLEEQQSKAPQELPRNHQVPFKEIFSNISTSDAKEALVRKFKDCHSSLRNDSCSDLPQVKSNGATFARGGHGIFGQPLSEYEKQNRLKYQEDLLEQIKSKQEKLKAEKLKDKLEEEKFMKQIEEQERKFQQEQEEINRKLEEEERLKKLERERYIVLKYQRELLEQIQMKKEMKEKEVKERLEEEVLMLRMQEEQRKKHEKELEEIKEHIKFVEPIKLQTRKPIMDILKYQEELLDQIQFKQRLEELERKRSFLEDEEMMKQSQEKDDKLQQELRLRTARGFKKLDLSQDGKEDDKGKLNELRLQEELLDQIRLKQQKLIEEKLKELALDEELLKLQEEKKVKSQMEIQVRQRRRQFIKESSDTEYQMELINQMNTRRQLELEEKQKDLLEEEELMKVSEGTFGLQSRLGSIGGKLKDQINEINRLKVEKEKINNLKYKAELLEQMRLKEEMELLRKEEEKLADLELLRLQEEKEMRSGREVKKGRLLRTLVESDNEKEEYDKIRRLQYLDELLNQIEAKRQEMREIKEHETIEDEILLEESRKMDRRRSIEEREMRKRRKNRLKLPLIDPIERNSSKTEEKNMNATLDECTDNSPVPSTRRHRTCSNVKRKIEKGCSTSHRLDQDNKFHNLDVQSGQIISKESNLCLSQTNSSSEFNSCKVCFTPSTLSVKSSSFLPKMSSKPATPVTVRRSNSLHDDKATCHQANDKKDEIVPENGQELWQIVADERAKRLSTMDEETSGHLQ